MLSRARSAVGRILRAAPGLAFAALLAGCGDTSIGSSFMSWMPKTATSDAPADGKDLSKFSARPTCPGAEIRFGTESANVFEANKQGNEASLKFQLSVQRVARECDEVGANIMVRVGAAGRVVAGPKGATGKVDIPVRIAAVNGDKVLYTGMKVVSVEVQPPDFGANWTLVDEAVTIPADQSADTIIYVGIDDKARPAPKQEAKPRVQKPRRPTAPAADGNDPYPQMKPNVSQ